MHVNEIGHCKPDETYFPCYQSDMATPKPAQATTDRAQDAIASALRTLEAEGSGVDALTAALRDGLGGTFAAAVDMILEAQDAKRGAQDRIYFGIDRHPCFLRAPQRGEPRRSGNDRQQRCDPGAVVVG